MVGQSSKKAQLVALAMCISEKLLVRKFDAMFLKIMKKEYTDRIIELTIDEGSVACIRDAHKPVVSDLSRHVNIKYHFLVNHVSKANIKLNYVRTNQIIRDKLTKNLKKIKFVYLIGLTEMA